MILGVTIYNVSKIYLTQKMTQSTSSVVWQCCFQIITVKNVLPSPRVEPSRSVRVSAAFFVFYVSTPLCAVVNKDMLVKEMYRKACAINKKQPCYINN